MDYMKLDAGDQEMTLRQLTSNNVLLYWTCR